MTRQTWTAFVSAALFVLLAVPDRGVAGAVRGLESGRHPEHAGYGRATSRSSRSQGSRPTRPRASSTSPSCPATAADSRLTLGEALAAYWLPNRDTLPRDSVYPPGSSAGRGAAGGDPDDGLLPE